MSHLLIIALIEVRHLNNTSYKYAKFLALPISDQENFVENLYNSDGMSWEDISPSLSLYETEGNAC